MRRALTLTFLLALLFCRASAFGGGDSWIEVSTQHFVVMTDGGEKKARLTALQFEKMRIVFTKLFPELSDEGNPPVFVFAPKNRSGYETVQDRAYQGEGKGTSTGEFLDRNFRNYILVQLDAAVGAQYGGLYHEYTHYLFRHDARWMPVWLNEGFAEFFENTVMDSGSVRTGLPARGYLYFLQNHPLVPIRDLLTADFSSPVYLDKAKRTAFYGESWALVHYLQLGPGQVAHSLVEYMRLLKQGEKPLVAAERAFGDLDQMEKALGNYIHGASFASMELNFSIAVMEKDFVLQPMRSVDVDAVRADILIEVGRSEEASALLDKVLHDDPNNELAHETMGFIRMVKGDDEGAREWFDEAVKLGPTNYRANFGYALACIHTKKWAGNELIEPRLRSVLRTYPGFAWADAILAYYFVHQGKNLDEAMQLVSRALELEPDNADFHSTLADLYVYQKQFSAAITQAQIALELTGNEGTREALRNSFKRLKEQQADERKTVRAPAAPKDPSALPLR